MAAFSLVELLVVAILLIALGGGVAYFYLGSGKAGKTPGETITTPITKANETVCMTNLGSVRQSISAEMASNPDGRFPSSLTMLHLPAELMYCPVGKEPYQYDAGTGQVRCAHPGHERY